ncbi:presequence protease, mitochondrial precursor [Xenopus tropicalis]|uniref:Presequence protease, mitochondrial n=1 Tax=Xenopus tropicalis TaxID=8364 RepID=PREP_XENTR|nr:presequence protease, mitochondrial precursor [Xenopus tropicalis]Q28BR5.1 RecName: Full=Presequence protease, mitochondrial; AltName: Full=Pitrilysin metalloproteinase 1; Flags: Precursor [Xenopus tropicalis]CAJ82697.1 pitrilysin metalloproteinase 1 [Xenopus tropicalis]|eukprot:NP_001039262.1 presequence protease, mitochondrial precursor [Xenopus tropicalis]
MIRQCRAGLRLCRALYQTSYRWHGKSACERALRYAPGESIHGFTVNEVTPVPELFLTAVKLSHDNTGAKYLHVAREDSNNLFSVQFRTTPLDSTGVPHILEHTVLCGSQKYPCRDPFFKMLNRSLSTFMNAFTASDYTMYPFSTQNAKDFQNLLSVYLDAVFFPCLRELDFWQEGWRLEHENPEDPNSPLIFKGIVFNEMKGAFTDNEKVFSQHLQNKLLPDHTYSVVSGGEPLNIPDLTWEQLKQFHATHYHPSNARFFTYGNLPLEIHLKQIHEDALSKFERIDPKTSVPPQERWQSPREYSISCGTDSFASDPEKQTTVSVNFLLSEITDTFEAFTLSLLSSLMVDGPNSPFYKALIEANLGTDFSPDTGFNNYTRETYFSIGLQGINKEDSEKVKAIINKTINEVAEHGIEAERIEALLHKLEIQMKHQSTSFGLTLASYVASCWNHEGDPVDLLKIGDKISRFRECLKENPKFLQDKVKQYFQVSQHRMTLSMSPDEQHYDKEAQLEAEKLTQKVKALSEEERKQIYEKGLELIRLQSKPQDASCLPALKVSDIEPKIPLTDLDITYAGDVPVQYCAQPTNGMVYFRAVSSLNTLPEELKPYVPLFCSVITKLGCGVYNYREQAQQMELTTGGMSVCPHIITDDSNLDTYEQGVVFSSLCLDRNLPDMMHLWSEIFNSPHFDDEERLRVLVRMSAQEMSNGIPDSGHVYASIRAGRTLTPAGELQELFSGMDQVKMIKRIAEMPEMGPILRKLSRIRKYVLLSDNMRCSVNATPQQMPVASKEIEHFLAGISRSKKERKSIRPHVVEKSSSPSSSGSEISRRATRKLVGDPTFKPCQMKTHFSLSFPVNYIGECVRTVPYTHPDYASLRILARIMTAKFLHGEIREKGGAYGGGAKLSFDGIFGFYSYRDPNSLSTLSTFQKAADWAKSGQFTQQDVDEAKLSVFSAVDSPIAPSDKGMNHFLHGISDEMKQKHREQLFAVTHSDLTNASNKYLTAGQCTRGTAILGPENRNIAKDPSWIIR